MHTGSIQFQKLGLRRGKISCAGLIIVKILDTEVFDIRFPTSGELDGSDAMNIAPDYSAAYIILKTDIPNLEGHGHTFTIGRGNEICVKAIESLCGVIKGKYLDDITNNWLEFYYSIVN